jgi:hypothetical protein
VQGLDERKLNAKSKSIIKKELSVMWGVSENDIRTYSDPYVAEITFMTKSGLPSKKITMDEVDFIKAIYNNQLLKLLSSKMARGGGVKKGNYSYIPQEEIDYLVTEYGKKIDGNKLLDGAYAKGNTKAPKMVRTQFEEEDYEFAKGGGIGKDKIFGFGDDAANAYNMDIEELELNVKDEYNFGKYNEGVDYEWNIARGDDFPHAITIKNATMIKDSEVKEFLDFITESKPKGYMEKGGSIGSKINYQNDDFALVRIGGSIGTKNSFPISVNGKYGSITQTGNNKEMLKETAARMRKQLSAGERKHYGMSYTVVALTPAKVKEIERFKNK